MTTSAEANQSGTIDAERLVPYVREKLGWDRLQVDSLRRNVGGMSRETWFAEVSGESGGSAVTDSLTFRLDHPEGSVVPVPLDREYRIFAALGPTEVPVAQTLWIETDPEAIGRAPFYVRRTVPGSASAGTLYAPGNETLRSTIGLSLVQRLATVHTLDWRAAGLDAIFDVPNTPQEHALLELAHYERAYHAADPEPLPIVELLFSWLKRNVPSEVQRTSLVWGDVGVGNFIYSKGADPSVVALTDWEQAHLGDPMKDWASALFRGVDSLADRDTLFRAYEQASGLHVDVDRIRYYTVFICAEYICTSFPLVSQFGQDQTRDATFARLGIGTPYRCMKLALDAIGY